MGVWRGEREGKQGDTPRAVCVCVCAPLRVCVSIYLGVCVWPCVFGFAPAYALKF